MFEPLGPSLRSVGKTASSTDHLEVQGGFPQLKVGFITPLCSIYGIFTYIWVIFSANVGTYSINRAYGTCIDISITHVHKPPSFSSELTQVSHNLVVKHGTVAQFVVTK